MAEFLTRTPFGNPDGSRSDIKDVVDNFITFGTLGIATGLGVDPEALSPRVIVGAKGSGKTVYLRRLRAAAADNESVYADIVQQDLPSTSNIVKFCQCFGKSVLTEKWMELWYCAILRSLVTHLLHVKQLSTHLTEAERGELEDFPEEIVPRSRREVSVYSQVTDIIHRHHTAHAFSRFFDHPAWAELATTIGHVIAGVPPVYFFIDSVDEEYASAPMYWLQCQKGLFFRAMRFLRDQNFGGRLHVIVCVRDHVLASVLRGEHQNRYRGEPHITTLGWEYASAEYFLKEKISRLPADFLVRTSVEEGGTIESWLGHRFIENRGRQVRELALQYLLRHTRLLPRDIVILGNRLCELISAAKRGGRSEVPQEAIRRCVREAARSFGNEQLAICANHVASSGMPADAARMEYDEIYTGDSEYSRGFVEHLHSVIKIIGKDRFGPDELELGILQAADLFGERSDALSVLWQNRLLGYVEPSPDGPREVFFSELNCDHFSLPLDKKQYLLHSCLIDAVGIQPVGQPVGQGGLMFDWPTASSGDRTVTSSPETRRKLNRPPGPVSEMIGDYQVLGVIGRGAMGTVYLAHDPRLRRRVAIKVLADPRPGDVDALARHVREARILAALSHPNIATVYSLENDGGMCYLTMEYVFGVTLGCWIREEAPDTRRVLHVCRQMALGLDAAHQKGIIHRDLKPSNVMVTPEDVAKVLDFGIAKAGVGHSVEAWVEDHRTSSGIVLGTVGYMSPEQLRGHDVDTRSDIWAFGCCLFECLTGREAFQGRTAPERVSATIELQPDWGQLVGAPDAIRGLLTRCLEKDPARRLSTMSEAIEAIDGLVLG